MKELIKSFAAETYTPKPGQYTEPASDMSFTDSIITKEVYEITKTS